MQVGKSKQLLGVAVVVVLLSVIFVPFQQADAFTVTVDLPAATGDNNEITASLAGTPFEVTIEVGPGELISVDTVTLILDEGLPSENLEIFNSTGHFVGGHIDGHLVFDNVITIDGEFETGYGYGYGYGFVSNDIFSTDNLQNDFIGGNDQGPDTDAGGTEFFANGVGPGTITINGTLITGDLAAGLHTLDVLVGTGANGNGFDVLRAEETTEFEVLGDQSIVFQQKFEIANINFTQIQVDSLTTLGYTLELGFWFSQNSTEDGNIDVLVQSVEDYILANPDVLSAQGLEVVNGQLHFTTDDPDTTFIAAGFVMDIDLAELELPPGTIVTLNTTYSDDNLSPTEEQQMRIMHKIDDTAEWEALENVNATINNGEEVDAVNNFVFGSTDDFSLFAPAFIPDDDVEVDDDDDDDGPSGGGGGGRSGPSTVTITWPKAETFDDAYFLDNPLAKVSVSNSAFVNAGGVGITNGVVGQQISIAGSFTNHQKVEQDYAFIVQVEDEDGFVTDIAWQQGTVASGSTVDVSTLWTPQTEGAFIVKIFMWDGISTAPTPLSEVTVKNIPVS